jgi:phosphatidylinositol glycan class V
MTVSGLWALNYKTKEGHRSSKMQSEGQKSREAEPEGFPILRNLAVSQLLLTMITLTTAHVQIITRISSASPVCLWYLATQLRKGSSPLAGNAIRLMVIYGIVQGGLFASFLPPA